MLLVNPLTDNMPYAVVTQQWIISSPTMLSFNENNI